MPHSHSTDRTGISRRGFVTLSIAGAGVTAAAMAAPEAAYADEPALARHLHFVRTRWTSSLAGSLFSTS